MEDAISVPAFELPLSDFLGDESRDKIQQQKRYTKELTEKIAGSSFSGDLRSASKDQLPEIREFIRHASTSSPGYLAMTKRYPAKMAETMMEGVCVEVFTPPGGVAARRRY